MSTWGVTDVNRIVRFMIYSDFLVVGATGFLSPVFAIFVTQQISGATIATVGFAAMIYWIVKSFAQLPISRLLDKVDGEEDDYWAMVVGTALIGFLHLGFLMAREVWHVYLLQAVMGLIMAFAFPAYAAIFTRHIDRRHEGFEWSLHSLAVGLGFAGASAAGGLLADRYGFSIIFILVALFLVFGAALLLCVKDQVIGRRHTDRNHASVYPPRNGRT